MNFVNVNILKNFKTQISNFTNPSSQTQSRNQTDELNQTRVYRFLFKLPKWQVDQHSNEMKYFKNTYKDYSPSEDSLLLKLRSLISSLVDEKWKSTVHTFLNLESDNYSVYTGTSGIALLKLKKLPFERGNLEEVKCLLSLHQLKNHRYTFLCGDAGPLSIGVIVSHRLGNQAETQILIERLKELGKCVLDMNSDIPDEYLYGRAGYLYSILYVNKNVHPQPFDDNFIRMIIEAILVSGRTTSKALKFKVPLMYQWHNSYYLGAAHGISGILYLLLQAKEFLTEKDLNTLIKPTIEYLLDQRFASGNFPSSLGRDSDKYVQWCHGAPGFLYLLTTAYKVIQSKSYDMPIPV
ncbi:unnamed protein product [Phaedon cochleariae]|uniref:Uncharacterized protein n=1 Tax=Phaedon cochleariae TaxID=80249 RepID=A0A9P0DMT2_PHACE|nr:unnamed protein product [Phaedon cochleariae]